MAKIPNIAGIKDSSGNWENLKGYIHATQGMDFSVLSGNDSLILPALKEGGVGGITAVANIYPETMVSIYRRFLAGDLAGAEEAQNSIAPIRACFKFGNPNRYQAGDQSDGESRWPLPHSFQLSERRSSGRN